MQKLNEDLAEIVGAFIGDGCLSRYYIKKRKKWQQVVLFTGSWKNDSLYYKNVIQPIIQKYFKIQCELYHRKDDNTVLFRTYDKNFIQFFLSLGFNFGPKAGNVTIPNNILIDKQLVKGCIRGVFNTDGTVYQRYSRKHRNHPKHYTDYKVVQFKSKSKELMKQIRAVLLDFGFKPNRLIADGKACKAVVCRITSQNKINKFEKEINTTHPYHMKRSLTICKK